MRIVFVGASQFGLFCLERILSLPEIEVVGVITNPRKFSISYRPSGVVNVLHADFHPLAQQYGIPLWVMEGKMSDPNLIEQVRKWAPDFILVVGWYHMVPRAIRNIAPTAGLHASLLPDYSGGAPLVWAIINGEERTGITFFVMEDGVDSGPIVGQAEEPILFEDTIATLYARIEKAGLRLLLDNLPKIARQQATYTPQDERRRRIMPQRSPEDGIIDWRWPAYRIYNFIRAQTKPYPGAFTYLGQEKVTIWKASLPDMFDKNTNPSGTIVRKYKDNAESLSICCADGRLLDIDEIGLSDDRIVRVEEFCSMRAIPSGVVCGFEA